MAHPAFKRLLRGLLIVGAFMFVLSFTALSWLPSLFALALFVGPYGIVGLLIIAGSPFAGYLFTLLLTKRGERLSACAELTGGWLGAFGGAAAGLTFAGDAPWT